MKEDEEEAIEKDDVEEATIIAVSSSQPLIKLLKRRQTHKHPKNVDEDKKAMI